MKLIRRLSALALPLALSGCDLVVMSPSGDIAMQQRDLIIISVVLMLLIIIPVICLTLYFAWHYRRSNTSVQYSTQRPANAHITTPPAVMKSSSA